MNTSHLKPAYNSEKSRQPTRQKPAVFRFVLLLISFVALSVISLEGWGQTTIFTETMGTVGGTTTIAAHETANGFDNDSYTMTGTSDLRATTVSSGYTGASGSANVFLTGTIGIYFQIANISTVGYSGLSLSFGAYKSTTASNMTEMVLEYSTDGATYISVSFPAQPTGAGTANWRLITSVSLPAGAEGQTNLRLRWRQTSTTPQFRIDDIMLTGTSSATPTIILADNSTQITPANVNQGTTNHVIHKSSLAITTANATLTGMTGTTNGTYISADVTNLKVWYSADNSFSSGSDVLLSTLATPGAAGGKTFPAFSQVINASTTGYIFITADIAAGATVGNTIYLDALTTSNFTFSSGTKSGSTTASGAQTFVAATPSITLANNGAQITAANVNQGTTNHIIHKSTLAVTAANATLTGMTCSTNGTYFSADLTNLKVWYSADNSFSSGTDVLLSTLATPGAAGGKTFPAFSQVINASTTGYIFITADIAAGATVGNTIYLDALTTSNFTYSSGNKSGSTTASGAQTFMAPSTTCGSETFANLCVLACTPGSSSYGTRSWTGDDGIGWVATDSRSDQTLTTNAITIRTGTLTSGTYSGGISSLTVSTKLPFSDAAGNLDVKVNGTVIGTVPYSSAIQTTTISNINVSGNVIVQFANTTTKRITIDDISWTCYGCNPPTLNTATQAAAICDGASLTINLTGLVANSTNNTIEYTIAGAAQLPVAGINASGTGTASFTIDDLTLANNGQTLQITKITNGSCSTTFTKNVTLNIIARPATPTVSSNSPICAGSNLNLFSDATGTIAWTGPNSFTSSVQDPTITSATAAASGIYYVTSTAGGCTSYQGTTTVSIEGTTASITITPSPSNIVTAGTLVTFTALPINGGPSPIYQWQKNGSNVGTNSNTYSDATLITGDYITCTMTSNSSCVALPTVISNTITMTVTTVMYYCGYEDFTNSNASATYSDRTFTGNNGVTWSFIESRDENNDANNSGIDIPALMFRDLTSRLTSGAVPGGIGDFSVKLYKGFTGAGTRQVQLLVNGVIKGTSATFDDDNEHVFTVTGINLATVNSVALVNLTGRQIIVDDISWTCYGNTTPTLFVSEPSLTGMQYVVGNGPSAPQSYQVSGVLLTGYPGNITVNSPSDYEISLDNITYSSVLFIPYTSATLTSTTVYVRLVAGLPVGTFNNEMITHSGGGATSAVSVSCNGNVVSSVGGGIAAGDLAILAFNTDIMDGNGTDEISFVCFVPIPVGTIIDITDNAYRKCGDPNGWGVSEGWIRLERTTSELPQGVIITVRVTGGAPTVVYPDANWIGSQPQPTVQGEFNMNANGEQIFFMAGGEVTGNASAATSDAGRYSGYFLYGFNTKRNVWTPVCANATGGGTQNSAKPDNFDCFLVWPTAQADRNKYTGDLTPASQRNWIDRIGDTLNWSGYASDAAYDLGPNYYQDTLDVIPGGFSNGKWNGNTNVNWFECSNWESMRVPENTTNVSIPALGVINEPTIGNPPVGITNAFCNDFTIFSPHTLTMNHANSRLDIYGNLTQNGSLVFSNGIVNFMDDNSDLAGTGNMDFYHLAMKKIASSNTLTIGKDITINTNGILTLTNGIITTDIYKVTINNKATAAITGHPVLGSTAPNSYINGKLRRYVNATGSYDFPVGTATQYEYANINLTSSSGLGYIDAFFTAPHTTPVDISPLGLLVNSDLLMELLNYGFWTITPNAGTYNYDVTLTSRGHTNQGLTAGSHAVIKRPNVAAPWVTQGTHNNATQSMGSGWNWVTAKRTALAVFSDFAIAKNNVNSPLPVDLLSFSATCDGQGVDLKWTTASETNNDFFTIEKSSDAVKWEFVGNINGNGNSNARIDYSFSDNKPLSGTSYYRLKQTDFDGRSETFSPVAVICGGYFDGQGVSYFPNPFTSEIYADLSMVDFENAVIRVYDMLGNMVFEKSLTSADAENQTIKLNLEVLKVGIYTVEFKSESFTNVAKVVKNNYTTRY